MHDLRLTREHILGWAEIVHSGHLQLLLLEGHLHVVTLADAQANVLSLLCKVDDLTCLVINPEHSPN